MNNFESIQNGDLLIWSEDKKSDLSNAYLKVIRAATSSEYAHTGIAWWLEGRLFVLEATMPNIRLVPIDKDDEFFCVSMGLNWTTEAEDYLIDKVGLVYSLLDAIRGYLGIRLENDRRYQCAELCNEFYKLFGIDLGDNYTPSSLVREVLVGLGYSIRAINNKPLD